MNREDRVLALLANTWECSAPKDVGFGCTLAEGRCARCTRFDVANGSSFCAGCRAWMAGGDIADPKHWSSREVVQLTRQASELGAAELRGESALMQLWEDEYQRHLRAG